MVRAHVGELREEIEELQSLFLCLKIVRAAGRAGYAEHSAAESK